MPHLRPDRLFVHVSPALSLPSPGLSTLSPLILVSGHFPYRCFLVLVVWLGVDSSILGKALIRSKSRSRSEDQRPFPSRGLSALNLGTHFLYLNSQCEIELLNHGEKLGPQWPLINFNSDCTVKWVSVLLYYHGIAVFSSDLRVLFCRNFLLRI
jgi:hypothetical protein